MNASVTLLDACGSDAVAISRIIGTAIRTACAADHRNDQRRIAAWLRNTSPAHILRQLNQASTIARLAVLQGKPIGVGMVHGGGEILHCYVLPEYSRRGVGTALMGELEERLLEQGRATASLSSTLTGCGFYRHLGYSETGDRLQVDGLTVALMEKNLLRPAMGDWAARLSTRL